MDSAVQERAGHRGQSLYVGSGTTAFTAATHSGGIPWTTIQIHADTVFTTISDLALNANSTAREGDTFPAGQILTGQFTAVTRASGRYTLHR